VTRKEFKRHFPPRDLSSHKGDFGKIFIIAGSKGFSGAPYLVSLGALRAGAGLITLAVPQSLYPIVARKSIEVMVRPLPETKQGSISLKAEKEIRAFLETQDVLAIGPGLGQQPETQKLIRDVALSCRKALVMDADAINAFQGKASLLKKLKGQAILTPHPGEAFRLFGARVPKDDEGRKKYAQQMARRYRMVLVLKGHHTVVAASSGRADVNLTGNPGLATGGSGDILTGIIAAFLGAGRDPFSAAKCAVFIHGSAADLAAKEFGEISLTPMDVLKYLPRAFKKILKH